MDGINQLYTDVEKAMVNSLTSVRSKDVSALYAAHVKAAKAAFPDDYILQAIPDEIGDMAIGAMLILCGQLREAVRMQNVRAMSGG